MTPDAEHLRAFAEGYTAAWCSMDPARVAEQFAPEGSLTINDGPPAIGRTAITEVARGFYVACDAALPGRSRRTCSTGV